MNSDELLGTIWKMRKLHFGFHLFTYGESRYKLSLIDWEVKPPADNVVWENEDEPDELLSLISKAYAIALRRRETVPV